MTSSSKTSPCIGICRIERGFCVGCLRSLEEIVKWRQMDTNSRLNIMKNLQSRKNIEPRPQDDLKTI
ncbi:MAG: DUF1289 domain-containing protein [Syntrophus sp. (in: bacteria)]|nr:DUF1289 domain-containing protein [Syntrophus sp. (in: bacteria)]